VAVGDILEAVLRLVEAGKLGPQEAAEILAALDQQEASQRIASDRDAKAGAAGGRAGRSVTIAVTDGGKNVVNLRLPASLGELALLQVPGLSEDLTAQIREALRAGTSGDLVNVTDEHGSGVRIAVE
jgi:hypothetical protein